MIYDKGLSKEPLVRVEQKASFWAVKHFDKHFFY